MEKHTSIAEDSKIEVTTQENQAEVIRRNIIPVANVDATVWMDLTKQPSEYFKFRPKTNDYKLRLKVKPEP